MTDKPKPVTLDVGVLVLTNDTPQMRRIKLNRLARRVAAGELSDEDRALWAQLEENAMRNRPFWAGTAHAGPARKKGERGAGAGAGHSIEEVRIGREHGLLLPAALERAAEIHHTDPEALRRRWNRHELETVRLGLEHGLTLQAAIARSAKIHHTDPEALRQRWNRQRSDKTK